VQNILVIGATGTVGSELVSCLLEANVHVRALLRDPDAARLPPDIERVRGDLTDPASIDRALANIDAAFVVWTAPPATAPAVIDKLAAAVPRLVLLTAPHRTPHPFFQQPNPMRAMFSAIEDHIASTRLDYCFIRPGMFASNCLDWWGPAFRSGEVVRWPLLEAPTAPIDPRDIAAVAARALLDPPAGNDFIITGPESLTQREQLQIIADTLGVPLECEDLTADEAKRTLPGFEMLLAAWTAALGQPAYVTTTVADLVGTPRAFREWAEHNAAAFRATWSGTRESAS